MNHTTTPWKSSETGRLVILSVGVSLGYVQFNLGHPGRFGSDLMKVNISRDSIKGAIMMHVEIMDEDMLGKLLVSDILRQFSKRVSHLMAREFMKMKGSSLKKLATQEWIERKCARTFRKIVREYEK